MYEFYHVLHEEFDRANERREDNLRMQLEAELERVAEELEDLEEFLADAERVRDEWIAEDERIRNAIAEAEANNEDTTDLSIEFEDH